MTAPTIEFVDVHANYGAEAVLRGLSFHVLPGEFMVLVGPSGCGKTTCMKLVNRLLEPASGSVRVAVGGPTGGAARATTELDPIMLRRSVGYVFQRFGLFPHMTVAGNVGIVPELLGWDRVAIEARTRELAGLVGLDTALLQRLPRELSGGQQQRIGLARALATRPRLMLMDEPFGALDPLTRDALQQEYLRLHRQLSLTTLMVTHDMSEALLLADRILVLRQGRMEQLGTPAELLTAPGSDFVADLISTPRRQAERLEQLLRSTTAAPP